uniref:Uncharacterized protein n=1 Tax=viral metagenome TaxID=1070528 RepID=A0A6C0LC29_9ZZZZ
MESSIIYLFSAFLGGVVVKWYDDLCDNEKLAGFKTDFLMELLKGLHFIIFTALSLNEPLFFIINYAANFIQSFTSKEAWYKPYENSLLYSFLFLGLLVDYTKIKPFGRIKEYVFLILFLLSFTLEPLIISSEYSLLKLISRLYLLACSIYCLYILPQMSNTLRYIFIYMGGYCLASAIVQYYSLFIHIDDKSKNTITETITEPIKKEKDRKKKRLKKRKIEKKKD